MLFITVSVCGGLTLDGCQVTVKASPALPSSARHRREKNAMKGLWVKIRAGRDHSPITPMSKRDSPLGN